jgi:F0F1-type ATP synthase assembly protein I
MPKSTKERPFSYSQSARSLQENASRSGNAAAGSYTLVGAIILFGGLGYGFDYWRGTAPWGVFIGLMLGVVIGFYELIKTTLRR